MARHLDSQDVASPQLPTILSTPRSSRAPSLSFVHPLKQKPNPLPIRRRTQNSISTLTQLTSPRNSPPPDFLLDEDPFANLTRFGTAIPPPQPQPQLPLPAIPQSQPQPQPQSQPQPQPQPAQPQLQPQSPPQRPLHSPPRPLHHSSLSSSTSLPLPHRPSPAHQRPAFKSRPSLPSLNTLSKMNFAGFDVRKVRKGKVGAGLPFEPWDYLGSRPSSGETSSVEEEDETVVGSASSSATPLPSLISVIESASTSDHELEDSNTSSPPSPPRSFSIPPSSSPTYSSDYESGDSKTPSPPSPPRSFSISPSSSPNSSSHELGDSITSTPPSPPRSFSISPSSSPNSSSHELGDSITSSPPSPPRSFSIPPSSSPTYTSDYELGDSKTSSPPYPPRSFSIPPSSSPASTSGHKLGDSKASSPPSPPRSFSIPLSSSPTSTSDYELGDSKTSSGKLRVSDVNKISSSSPKETLEVGPHSLNVIPALRHDDDNDVHIYEDDDADQFMDQFMEHYDRLDREEDNRDYAQDQKGPIQEEVNDVMVSLGERVVVGEGGDEIQMQLPPPRNNGSRFSESEDDDDDDDNDDDEDQEDDDEDDDMPLAQRIPGALTVQKSIRRQVRQEREKKKQEKALRNHTETTRTRLMTLRPGAVPSSSHDTTAALVASQTTMQRNSRTLTRKESRSWNPFSREDSLRKRDNNGPDGVEAATTPVDATSLYQRLHSLHRSKSITRPLRDVRPPSAEALPPVPIPQNRLPSSQPQRAKSVKEPSSLPYQFPTSPSPTPINSAYAPSSMTPLRPTRSFHFHRPSIDRRPIGMDDPSSVPLPLDAEKRISQISTNITRSRSSTRDGPQPPSAFLTATPTHHHHRSLSRSRSINESASPTTIPESVPVPPIPTTARISHGSNRISEDADKHLRVPTHQHRPAPSVSSPADHIPMINPELVVQQRVFIGNMQRFNMVEIGASTTAGDIIEMVKAERTFKDFAGSGGWMVFEVAQDFGMERPIRSFELVADVQSSWNKDKMVNYLVLRMTPLEVPLNRSAIPSFSPTHSGYVQWEAKRGKWSKRFMQLREHSIWLSKRESGQDQVHLCSLSNFDAYRVTRIHRAPKPFVFAVKSTDNLSFFENTADYLHSFACSEKEGMIWMEKILVARSYVLFQERHVLFNPKPVVVNTSGVSRSGTRKATTTIQRSHHDIFEPGSLLSKQL